MRKVLQIALLALALLATDSLSPPEAIAGARSYTDAEIDRARISFKSTVDKFNGSEVRRLKTILALKGQSFLSQMLAFDLLLIVTEGRDSVFAMQFAYSSGEWAFLNGTGTLLLDSERRIEIGDAQNSPFKPRRDVSGRLVSEQVTVLIPCETLAALSTAHQVELRLSGDRASVEVWFPKEALAAFRTLRIEAGCFPTQSQVPSQERSNSDSTRVD